MGFAVTEDVTEEGIADVIVGFVSCSTEVNDGLKVVSGGLPPKLDRVDIAELGFSLSYLFKYVIKFSFDFKLS